MSAFPDHQRVTPNMARKGRRLHSEGKVRFLPQARVYAVEGDHNPYIVVANGDQMSCNCPHHGTCSHVQAVRIARRTDEPSARVIQLD